MSKHKFKILSLDGGGIKGIIPCTILRYIEDETGLPIHRLFDLLAGTSTGGIIALGLTRDKDYYSAQDMLDLYVEHGKDIFSKRPSDFKSWFGSLLEKGILDKNFDERKFEKILADKFGDSRLKDSRAEVFITTYELGEERPFYFSSRLAKQNASKEDYDIRKIARSTSAAPTYFKPSQVGYADKKRLTFVDGGVFANNPSILAYAEAKELWKKENKKITVVIPPGIEPGAKAFDAVVTPDDLDLPFYMLSIGCGHSPTSIDYSEADDWRVKDWIKPLLTNVFMQGVAESTDYIMEYLLPPFTDLTPRYRRLNLLIPEENSQMDDTSDKNINALRRLADEYVKINKEKLDEICEIFKEDE
jgi:uncharacterized protein